MSKMDSTPMAQGTGTPAAMLFDEIRGRLKACMQCGTCTGSCPNSGAMDLVPRELWRLIQLGFMDEVFESKSFWLCAGCYTCTLRCPRGLPLIELMGALKHLALSQGIIRERKSPSFYRAFLENVRRNGRVRESELMGSYFLSMKNPVLPFSFMPLGWKLMTRGKLSIHFPKFSGEGKLDKIYRKALEIETSGRNVHH